MKYCWPLVLIGGTLLVVGSLLPSFWRRGGLLTESGFVTGIEHGGITWAVGGAILMLIALLARERPGGSGLALLLSALCLLVIMVVALPEPICGDCATYSPDFGLSVSFMGALVCIIGSLMRMPDNPRPDKRGALILIGVEAFIICLALTLIVRPVLGDWLGFWHTSLPAQPCQILCSVGNRNPTSECSSLKASCYATATAQALQLTPPAWWPLGH